MKKSWLISVGILNIALLASRSLSSYATPVGVEDKISSLNNQKSLILALVKENPGTSYDDIVESAKNVAMEKGISEREVLWQAVNEVKYQKNTVTGKSIQSGSNPRTKYNIGKARHRGDIFYTPSTNLGIRHGHSGIYSEKGRIVEANPGKGVTERAYMSVKVDKGAVKQYVSVRPAERERAADQAKTYIGRSYNYNFAFNKTHKGPMNCSQVVWASYKMSIGVDLDSNGGHGVYPADIRDSNFVYTYGRF